MIDTGPSDSDYVIAAEILTSCSSKVRRSLFECLHALNKDSIICSTMSEEIYNVSTKDRYIAWELYGDGVQHDFRNLEWAMERSRAHGHKLEKLVDIGANVGGICIPAVARNVVKQAIAVEPHPLNCRLLRSNVALNGIHERVLIYEAAVGQKRSRIELEESVDNYGDHRVFLTDDPGKFQEHVRSRISVNMLTLDEVLSDQNLEEILIWIDVQGYEGGVLGGASNTLKHKPPIFMELWPYGLNRADGFGLVMESLSGYSGFYDCGNQGEFKNIEELRCLYNNIGCNGEFTDILIL